MPTPVVRSPLRSTLPRIVAAVGLIVAGASLLVLAFRDPHPATLVLSPIVVVPPAPSWLGPALLGPLPQWPVALGLVASVATIAGVVVSWRRRSVGRRP